MPSFSPADLIRAAQAQTGLDTFDSDSFREGLDVLAFDHSRSSSVTEQGMQVLTSIYTANLANRLRVAEYLRTNPQVLNTPVKRPVFIGGMPRTGTTMISYLLDRDPANRSLLKWEIANSAPPAAAGELRTDPRCLEQMQTDDAFMAADPSQAARHYEAADGPSECTFLHAQDFKSLMLDALSPQPTYFDWLLSCDMTSAYEYQRKVLQILQSTNPGRWALKMPSHALFVRTLFKVFPDARVIWAHRDPYEATGSALSLIGSAHPVANKGIDVDYLANRYPLQMSLHIKQMLDIAEERPDAIYHCYYNDLVKDPKSEMKQIYAWLGDDFTPEADAGMDNWIAENPQGRFGKHEYSLGQWGLSVEQLRPYFADYLKLHPVAR